VPTRIPERRTLSRIGITSLVLLGSGRLAVLAAAQDFDGDGALDIAVALDAPELVRDQVAVLRNSARRPDADRNGNGVLDRCEFVRGDVDRDRRLTVTDAIVILGFLFLGGARPACLEAADVDDSGHIELTDPVRLLLHVSRAARRSRRRSLEADRAIPKDRGPIRTESSTAARLAPRASELARGIEDQRLGGSAS
jgi:hypothetical protein